MADTANPHLGKLKRPTPTEPEKLFEKNYDFGADIPPLGDTPVEDILIADPELWRQEKYWDRFAKMRKEDPLHYTPDSFVGPFWSVTRYEDIMAVDIDHQRFSSSWEHGGITLGEPPEGFELPMFIAMDEPQHGEQRKTVQPAVGPPNLKEFEPLIRERTQNCSIACLLANRLTGWTRCPSS